MSYRTRLTTWLRQLLTPRTQGRGLPRPTVGPAAMPQSLPVPVPTPPQNRLIPRGEPALPRIGRLYDAFDTSVPVIERSGLAGRSQELQRLLGNVLEQHRHAVVYGARGSGKTSLARVFADVAAVGGATVLYDIASSDGGFSQLLRPLLTDLLEERGGSLRPEDVTPFETQDFDARRVAGLFAERLDGLTVIILDEFDQVRSLDTKRELAVLMKLLSDMRAPVRIVTVGIASDLADLITGHPSMRRHVVAVPVGAIGTEHMTGLLAHCISSAGLTISDDAGSLLVDVAGGSPFHLRLFGLHAALEAHGEGCMKVEHAHVLRGLGQAFRDWYEMDDRGPEVIRRIDEASDSVRAAIHLAITRAAGQKPLDEGAVAERLQAQGWPPIDANHAAAQALIALDPILMPASPGERRYLADTLAPHFLLLLDREMIERPVAPGGGETFTRPNGRVGKAHS